VAGSAVYGQQLAKAVQAVAADRKTLERLNTTIRSLEQEIRRMGGQVHDGAANGVHHGLAAAASGAQHKANNHPKGGHR